MRKSVLKRYFFVSYIYPLTSTVLAGKLHNACLNMVLWAQFITDFNEIEPSQISYRSSLWCWVDWIRHQCHENVYSLIFMPFVALRDISKLTGGYTTVIRLLVHWLSTVLALLALNGLWIGPTTPGHSPGTLSEYLSYVQKRQWNWIRNVHTSTNVKVTNGRNSLSVQ